MTTEIGLLVLALCTIAATFRWPGWVAGAAWSFLPIYGILVPGGLGLALCLSLAGVAAVRSFIDLRSPWLTPIRGHMMALLAAGWIIAYEIGSVPPSSTGLAMAAAVAIALCITVVGTSSRDRARQVMSSVAIGAAALSGAEVLRVVGGGAVHAATGAFGVNPIIIGQYAVIAALVAQHRFSNERSIIWVIVFGVATLGLLASGSQGPLLGFVLAELVMIVASVRSTGFGRRTLAMLLVPLLATTVLVVAAVGKSPLRALADESLDSRLRAWSDAVGGTLEAPLTGHGPGRYAGSASSPGMLSSPHNVFLEAWSEYGLVAMALLMLALIYAVKSSGGSGLPLILAGVVSFSASGSLGTTLPLWVSLAAGIIVGSSQTRTSSMSPIAAGKRKES